MLKLRAFWKAWWQVCPNCNSDAPAVDGCAICSGSRERYNHTMTDSRAAFWLAMYLEKKGK